MEADEETAPLLGRIAPEPHPIYLRAAHSPWPGVSQPVLITIRAVLAGYLTAVLGVALKYKLEIDESHTKWLILFQFATVSFLMLWAWHILLTVWAAMHHFFPDEVTVDPEDSRTQRFKAGLIKAFSAPRRSTSSTGRFAFSLFYAATHTFAFMYTLIYWGVLVPSGHGGFRPPSLPKHQHPVPGENGTVILYDPDKGMFEEDDIKPFSIINLSIINSVIAAIELFFLNSIRRPTPVQSHTLGVILAAALYLVWAWVGEQITGHPGIFFLESEELGGQVEAVIAACIAFISLSPGLFAYVYGLIAMREQMTAAPRSD